MDTRIAKKLTKERNKNGSSPLPSVGGIPLLNEVKMRLGTTKAMTERQRLSLDSKEQAAMTNDDEYDGGGDDVRFCFIFSKMRLP